LALCETHPDYKDGSFELIHGEIVEKVTTLEHGIIGARLIYFLQSYLMKTNKGYLGVEVTSRNPNNTMNVRKPDISYYLL
jgi:Uma2 family endonuclease